MESATKNNQMSLAISNARESFNLWKETPLAKRIQLIKSIADELEKQREVLIRIIQEEVGKPQIEASTEIDDSKLCIDYYCEKIKTIKEQSFDMGLESTDAEVIFEPYGVIGIIMPWNYPLSLPFWTIIPALLTGNTIVFKPSENSNNTGKKIDEIINNILPKGVFNSVHGNRNIGRELVKSDIDKLFFTGSLRAGEDIIKNIRIKPLELELGGKDAAIVCEDADIDFASKGIVWGAINNVGQVCTSIEKVYVSEKIQKEFIEKVVEEVKKLRKGIDYGRIINKVQADKIEKQIKEATSNGAKILIGGKRQGLFIEPTVIANLKEDMTIMQEETFGPVIKISPFKNEEEAVSLINKSKYGLGVTIWTKNVDKGKKIGERINVGMVWINDVNLPFAGGDYWGGLKNSGIRNSADKLMQCLKAKTFVSYSKNKSRGWWYPYK